MITTHLTGLETMAFGGAERSAGGPKIGMRCGACPLSMLIGPHIARRAAPTRQAAPPHEMGVYPRRLVLGRLGLFCDRALPPRGYPWNAWVPASMNLIGFSVWSQERIS